MVNYIWLAWKLACMLRKYIKCDPTVGFSKYEIKKTLFIGVTFSTVTASVTWNQP